MAFLRVTTLAQHRAAHRQHAGIIRAMRVVAVATILGHRGMFPKIRSAFLRVAVEAGLIERHLGKLPFTRCAMSAMAAAAVHLALPDGVRIRFERLRALLLVAFEAHLGLRRRH